MFHCRNVIQVYEEAPDGYIDNDENFTDNGKSHPKPKASLARTSMKVNKFFLLVHLHLVETDDESCYSECSNNTEITQSKIEVNLYKILVNISSPELISTEDLRIQWLKNIQEENRTFGRFPGVEDCIFNIDSAAAPSRLYFWTTRSNAKHQQQQSLLIYLKYLAFALVMNYSTNLLVNQACARVI